MKGWFLLMMASGILNHVFAAPVDWVDPFIGTGGDGHTTPGFYAVRLEGGVAVEATAAPHTALYRFTFDGQGGNEKFVAKLDNLFELPSEAEGQGWEEDCTGFIGQYIHGNEPSHHVALRYSARVIVPAASRGAIRIRDRRTDSSPRVRRTPG